MLADIDIADRQLAVDVVPDRAAGANAAGLGDILNRAATLTPSPNKSLPRTNAALVRGSVWAALDTADEMSRNLIIILGVFCPLMS
jgi:hypothetical protein